VSASPCDELKGGPEHAHTYSERRGLCGERLAGLSLMECQTGETVLTAGSTTGRLFVLRSGAVEVVKDGVQIATVSAPGSEKTKKNKK